MVTCRLSDVKNLDVSGLNLGPCRLVQLHRSSGFCCSLPQKGLNLLINAFKV